MTAHPDDENNGVLVQLSRVRGIDTSLLTLTRGDGGQNEIGPELFEALGILRTEELAAVHRYDGAAQYFSRAYEFGFSFSVEETFEKWGRDEILRDVVRVVRTVRPDVILTLPLEAPGGGQHHQAAARLAVEAFRAAADPKRFPEQVAEGLLPWQARKVYQGGTGGSTEVDKQATVAVDTSAYDPVLGMSAAQFGQLARSNHKCQGAGQLRALPGTGRAAYALVDAEPKVAGREDDVLQGVPTTVSALARFAGGDAGLADRLHAIEDQARQAQDAFSTHAGDRLRASLRGGLANIVQALDQVRGSALPPEGRHELQTRLERKRREFEQALTLAQRITIEPLADDGDVVPGQSFTVTTRVWNQGVEPVALSDVSLRVPEGWTATRKEAAPSDLAAGKGADVVFTVTVPAGARYTQPYWKRNATVDRYDIEIPAHQTLPWSPPDVVARVTYAGGTPAVPVTLERPVFWRYEGRWTGGEKQKVVNVIPALSVSLTPGVAVMPLGKATRREFRVTTVNGAKTAADAVVRLEAPAGWTVEPNEQKIALRFEGEEVTSRFFVTAPATLRAGDHAVSAVVSQGGREFREGVQVIAYEHIQERHLLRAAASRVEAIDVKVAPGVTIGYVLGAGDEVPPAITQLGLQPVLLTPDDLAYGDLSRFSTIVTGIRAYNARKDLRANNQRLLDYAKAGGHVVVQYNKFEFNRLADQAPAGSFSGGGSAEAVSPFAPYTGSVTYERVTLEDAPMNVLLPTHPYFTTPNRIGPADFAGWVQERGLYFFGARDPHYVELLSSADPFPKNEGEKKGILVDAPVGKGTWTYVGLGLWRQLPAGTPGAYRLLANLLSRPRAQ